MVSIPKRVSEALKPISLAAITLAPAVSIPKRVSEALKLRASKKLDSVPRCFNP